MDKLKYTGLRIGEDTYSFSLFGKRWQDGQDLTPDEVLLFANVQLGEWEIVKNEQSKKEIVKEVEVKKEEIKIT